MSAGTDRIADGQRRPGLRRRTKLLWSVALTLLLLEIALRVATATDPGSGLAHIGRAILVPFRSDPGTVTAWYEAQAHNQYIVLDHELGWTVRPYGTGATYRSDARGVRRASGRDYADVPPEGVVRIVTVGDSFTHGDEIADGETWQAELERLDPGVEALNLGVGAYGTDQALLRWRRDGAPRRPHISILGIWPEDMCRNLNVSRFHLTVGGGFLTKPRFVADGDGLRLCNYPVASPATVARQLGQPSADAAMPPDRWRIPWELEDSPWFASRIVRLGASLWSKWQRRRAVDSLYCGTDPSGIELAVAICRSFAREATAAGSHATVLFLPMRELLDTYPADASFPLVQRLRAAGLDVIDLSPGFHRAMHDAAARPVFLPTGHYTPAGNALVARELITALHGTIDDLRRR